MTRDPRRVEVHAIRHPRGCRSYLIVDPVSREACLVDPLLEHVGETLERIQEHRTRVKWIVETHAHGDHISGSAVLQERLHAEVVVHPASHVSYASRRALDGEALPLGERRLVVHHAPGITPDSLVLEAPGALFTGDTLLIGTVGVRDAPGSDPEIWFGSLRRIFADLSDDTVLHPGHDDMGRTMTTLKAERAGNRWLRESDLEAFQALFAADTRLPHAKADEVLHLNREGSQHAPRELLGVAGLRSPVEVEEAQCRDDSEALFAPDPGPAGAPNGWPPELLVACGALVAAGTVLGWWVHPSFHSLSLAASLLLLGFGLPGWAAARHRKRRRRTEAEFYYRGPRRDVIE